MIKALYISLRCKQAKEFLEDIKMELENLGISEIEYDEKNYQIKTKNFTATAKWLNSSMMVLDCENTDYFILDISGEDYVSKAIRDWACRRIEYLQTCFCRKVKQLNGKDELIKILTENNAEVTE